MAIWILLYVMGFIMSLIFFEGYGKWKIIFAVFCPLSILVLCALVLVFAFMSRERGRKIETTV